MAAKKKTGKKKRKYTRRVDVTPPSKAAERDPNYSGHPLDHPERTGRREPTPMPIRIAVAELTGILQRVYFAGKTAGIEELSARVQASFDEQAKGLDS